MPTTQKKRNRATQYEQKGKFGLGGLGTSTGSILGVLDSLPSAQNESFNPDAAPIGENTPYKRGGFFSRMTGSGVRADRRNNEAYETWLGSKMADEEAMRQLDVEDRMNQKESEFLGRDIGEDPKEVRKIFGKSQVDKVRGESAEAEDKIGTAAQRKSARERESRLQSQNPQMFDDAILEGLRAPGLANENVRSGIKSRQSQDELSWDTLAERMRDTDMTYELGKQRNEIAREGATSDSERGRYIPTGDGRLYDTKEDRVIDVGGEDKSTVITKDALGQDIFNTTYKKRNPSVVPFKKGTGTGIKIDPNILQGVKGQSTPMTTEGQAVPLTTGDKTAPDGKGVGLSEQGGGGTRKGGAPWSAEQLDPMLVEPTTAERFNKLRKPKEALLPKQEEDENEAELIREIKLRGIGGQRTF